MTSDVRTLDTGFYAVDSDVSVAEFRSVAKVYARDVAESYDLTVTVSDLDWEVSKRAKRRAGAVKHRGGAPETVSLTWAYFQEHGWAATADVVRHELIHVHLLNEAGDASHGPAFRELADDLQTSVTCKRFAEPNWWVTCESCGSEMPRYRQSKLVKNPGEYRCGGCGGELVSRRASGSGD